MLAPALLFALVSAGPFRPINGISLPPSTPEFDFVVLGDNRPAGGGLPPTQTFVRILREVAILRPAFVMSSGDLLYGKEESLAQYSKECDAVSELLRGLGVPFFNAPGNHEMSENQAFQDTYLRRFGELYGSFDFGGCRFVALSTDEVGFAAKLSPTQWTFLTSAVAGPTPTFVFMHRPVFARKPDPEEAATVGEAAKVHQMLLTGNVKGVFQGHDHVFNHQKHDGIEYYISGGAGAPLDASPAEGGFFHYLLVHVKDGEPTVTVLPLGSIDVVQDGDRVRVGSYADADLPIRDLVLDLADRPSSVSGNLEKKGKLSPVKVTLERIEHVGNRWRAHVAFLLTKHHQTILQAIKGTTP